MRRKREDGKPEGLDRWLLTYADMITLLMAFFIMVYSMSVLNVTKFRQAAVSIRSGFGGMTKGQGRSILNSSASAAGGDTAGVSWRVLGPLVDFIDHESRQRNVTIGEDERGIVISMSSDSLLFDPGSAEVKPRALPFLDKIAEMLKSTKNEVRVEGHTCDLPPRASLYATNWELSTARATGILRYLVEQHGLPPSRFSAAGYGSMRPVAGGNSETNRARNRRVEIIIVRPEITRAITPKSEPMRITDPSRAAFQRR
jgi:chemotaxis protein MotB